ncbi:MAG: hypothetical protein IPN17_27325 [Deltaproteobacteria bacterium]|nr:hypothetical protein [Deltaproteobacteria bacterium]
MSLDGKAVGSFSAIEEAVQAVDFEVHRMGRAPESSARAEASWRRTADRRGARRAVAGVRRGQDGDGAGRRCWRWKRG